MSEASAQVAIPNVASTATTSRRSSSSARKPLSSEDIPINLVMKMGFSRRSVELAIQALSKFD